MVDPVKVEGLKPFVRALKTFDSDLPKTVRIGLNDAVQIVVDWARPRIPKRSGRAQRSLKAASTRTAARIQAGGSRAPYYPWLDFGGRVGRQRAVKRGFIREGRYIFKGLRETRPEFEAAVNRALVRVAEGTGLEVTRG